MNKTSPSYTEKLKRDAVRLVETSGKSKTQIARDLGTSDTTRCRWLKEYGQDQELNTSANGQNGGRLKDLEAENKRLRREVFAELPVIITVQVDGLLSKGGASRSC